METQTEYLPELLRTITNSLCMACIHLKSSEMKKSFQLCSKILSKVLPSMAPVGNSDVEGSPMKHRHKAREEDDMTPIEEEAESDVEVAKEATELDLFKMASGDEETLEKDEKLGDEDLKYDTQNHIKLSPSRRSALSRENSGSSAPATLMQACVQSFQALFHVYVSSCVIQDEHIVDILLQQLMMPNTSGVMPPSSPIPSLEQTRETSEQIRRLNLNNLPAMEAEAFLCACQLLVEFSSIPMYCTDYQRVLQTSFKSGKLFISYHCSVSGL
jgi:hypothetical protein